MSKRTKMNETEKLALLNRYYDEGVLLTWNSRKEARVMFDYLRGDQLPDDVVALLESRGQPVQWENVIQEIDTSLAGMKSMSKTEIEVMPRHRDDVERAKVLEKIHRATLDSTEWWSHKDRADKDLRMAGLACMEVSLHCLDEYDAQGKRVKEVRKEHLPVLECVIDMHSRKPDYADARYFHHSRLYDRDLLVKKFGKKAEQLDENEYSMARLTRTWYRDEYSNEIRIATWYKNVLLEDIAQPYTRTHNRFSVVVRRATYSHVKEYVGMYRSVKPFQDTINNNMLRLKNMMGSSKLLIEATAVDDADEFKSEYGVDNSVTVVNDGTLQQNRIKDIPTNNNIQQLLAIIQDARRRALQIMGVNPELLGTSTMRQSGVALEIKQNAGLVGLQQFMSTSYELDKDIFEISSAVMEEHFKAEQVYMILGQDGKHEQFYVNAYERDAKGVVIFEDKKPKQKSILSVGRYDIVLNQVPFNNGSSDAKMKSWAEIMKIIDPNKAAALIPSMLRDVGSPQAKETSEILANLAQQEAQNDNGNAQALQMKEMELQMQQMSAKVEEMMSKANLNNAKAEDIKSGGDAFEASRG